MQRTWLTLTDPELMTLVITLNVTTLVVTFALYLYFSSATKTRSAHQEFVSISYPLRLFCWVPAAARPVECPGAWRHVWAIEMRGRNAVVVDYWTYCRWHCRRRSSSSSTSNRSRAGTNRILCACDQIDLIDIFARWVDIAVFCIHRKTRIKCWVSMSQINAGVF